MNRTALVTGASRGIGRAIAERFASNGTNLILTARSRDSLDGVIEQVRPHRVSVSVVAADLADRDSLKRLTKELMALDDIDILVNNAGIAESAKFSRIDDDHWDRHLAVNLTAAFQLCREVLPQMLERGWGRVINIASTAGKVGYKYTAAYCASKHGLIGLTRALALETALGGVTVNAVCPGFVETDIAQRAVKAIAAKTGQSPDEALRWLQAQSPQDRLIEPTEVAALAVMLAGDDARGINGQAINLDGGAVGS